MFGVGEQGEEGGLVGVAGAQAGACIELQGWYCRAGFSISLQRRVQSPHLGELIAVGIGHIHGDCSRGTKQKWAASESVKGRRRMLGACRLSCRARQARLQTARCPCRACTRAPVREGIPVLGALRSLPSGPTGHSEGTAR